MKHKTNLGPNQYPAESIAFWLDDIARQLLVALEWTKQQRDKEGLDCGFYADIHFPITLSYPVVERWLEILEEAIEQSEQSRG